MEETTKNTETSNQQNDDSKVAKNFESNIKKLVAIVGGEELLFPKKKVKKDTLTTIVEGLVKEKKEALEKEVKEDLIKLLDKNVECRKAIAAKKAELEKLEKEKMKEFNDAAAKVFAKVDNIGEIEKSYYESLKGTEAKGFE